MLLKKEINDEVVQKVICYGTVLLLLLFLMKFLKRMANRTRCTPRPSCQPVANHSQCKCNPCPPSPPCCPCRSSEERNPRNRRRRHHHHAPEQWVPKHDTWYTHDIS